MQQILQRVGSKHFSHINALLGIKFDVNIVFIVLTIGGIVLLLINSAPSLAVSVMLEGTLAAITLSVKLCSIYAVWLSVIKMVERGGLSELLAKVCAPVTKRLFKNEDEETEGLITMNLATNILGLGGIATPLGISAMEKMARGGDNLTDNMQMFMVINCTSIQLFPATVIALRSTAGSASPSDIFIPSLIATIVTTAVGIMLVFLKRRFTRE